MRRLVLAALSGLAGVTAAWAQSLGAVKGTVLLGRPLDVVVAAPVEGDDPAAVCAEARVRFGETPLAASDVTLTVTRDDPRGAGLRIRTQSAVDEPFVQLTVRVGCSGGLTRQYTLLPMLAPERPPAPPLDVAAIALPRPETASPPAAAEPPGLEAPGAQAAGEAAAEGAGRLRRSAGVLRRSDAASTRPRPPRAPARAETPSPPPSWSARLSIELGSAMQGEGAPRLQVEPVAFESDEAFLQFLQARALGLGGEVAAAKPAPTDGAEIDHASGKAGAQVEDLKQASTPAPAAAPAPAAEEEDAVLKLALGAGGGVLVALLSLWGVYRAARRRGLKLTVPRWWTRREKPLFIIRKEAADTSTPADRNAPHGSIRGPAGLSEQRPAEAASAVPSAIPPGAVIEEVAVDWDAVPAVEHPAQREKPSAPDPISAQEAAPAPEEHDEPAVAALDLAALHELWERVDFFEDLGQIADAVAALRSFVLAHPRASEAPYLRWWRLASEHGLDARLAQATYEQHYHRLLQGDGRRGTLLDDAALLQRLQAEWPGQQARATVEQALASQPDAEGQALLAVRSLAAFDDLITLHGVLDLLPLLPMTEAGAPAPAASAKADDHVIEFDLSGWTLPPAPPPAAAR